MLVVSGLVESLAEVLIHDPGDLPDVVGVEDHIPGQVLRGPVQLLLAVALPAQPDMSNTIHTYPEPLPMQIKCPTQFICISNTRDTPWCQPVVTEPQTLGERALLSFLLVFWA